MNPHEGRANPVQCQLVYHISDSNQAVVFYQILHGDHNDFFVWKTAMLMKNQVEDFHVFSLSVVDYRVPI